MTAEKAVERFLPLKPPHFHILLTLSGGPAHGYGIRREVDERTGGRIVLSAGTLYETLDRLLRDGLLAEAPQPASATEASSRWRFYRLTPLGQRVLRAEVSRLEQDLGLARAKLSSLGGSGGRAGSAS